MTEESRKPTRPASADRRAARRSTNVARYTVDLDREQRKILADCAFDWAVDRSRIIRTLLYLLEADASLRARVERELFNEEESA